MTADRSEPIRIGISSCLLGDRVRFDGGHKRDRFLTETFGKFVQWVPVCPEVEAGLGTPRESMRLVAAGNQLHVLSVKTRTDNTGRLEAHAIRRVASLASAELSGYVLKKDSPSCGVYRVKVYGESGVPTRTGRGLFASALLARMPHLPVEEEGRLADPVLRENFVERVFAYARVRALFDRRWSVGALVRFHTAHKLMVMAHSPAAYRELGRLTAAARSLSAPELELRYVDRLMTALRTIATRRGHTNVLHHIAGYFKTVLDRAAKSELLEAIEDYRRELVPLIVPMTLVRHYVRTCGVDYLAGQLYLQPHPKELMLRNHV